MSIKVFLSVGRTFTQEQESFVQALEHYLLANGLTPQTVGRTYFSSQQPLKAVSNLMQECAGTIIMAYERFYVDHLAERRGSPEEKNYSEVALPTVWNQIEASMAYVLGHPLLVIVEHGLKSEGLLEQGYDWYVKWIKLSPTELATPEFIGIFTDWKRRVAMLQQQKAMLISGQTPISTHVLAIQNRDLLIKLRRILTDRFSEGELRLLCFDLGIDYDDLPGQEKVVRAMQLVALLQRQNRLGDLLQLVRKQHPDIDWPTY